MNSAQSFAITSGASLTYTISEISEWPSRFDDVVMYKAAWIVDPDNLQAGKWISLVDDAIGTKHSVETKRNRVYTIKGFPGLRR